MLSHPVSGRRSCYRDPQMFILNIRNVLIESIIAIWDYAIQKFQLALMCLDQKLNYAIFKARFYRTVGYWPDFSEPKTFNEKINWRKIHDRNPAYTIISDKLRVREYIRNRFGAQAAEAMLPKVLSVTTNPTSEILMSFGTGVAIKANHGSGWVEIVAKHSQPDWDRIVTTARRWLRKKYGLRKHEWAYHNIEPKVFIEELLSNPDGRPILDIKFHVMDGVCSWVDVSYDRKRAIKFVSATRDWQSADVSWRNYPKGKLPTKPRYFSEILAIAEKIGQDFDYIRIDFLGSKNQWKHGELTLYDSSGLTAYENKQVELHYGSNRRHRSDRMISTFLE